MAERESYIFRESYNRAMNNLDYVSRIRVMEAIIAYGLYDKEPDNLEGIAKGVWVCIKDQMDADRKRAEIIREKRAQAGSKGGKKKQANEAKVAKVANATKSLKDNELVANATFATSAPPHTPLLYNNSSSMRDSAREETDKEMILRWITEAGMLEQTQRVQYEVEQKLTDQARKTYTRISVQELIDKWYDYDYQVRELCRNKELERARVLSYYQNWLPNYMNKLIKKANEAATPTKQDNDNQHNQNPKHKVCRATEEDY